MQASPPRHLRVVFAGTPEIAATILAGMVDGGFTPDAVFSQPDKPKGRNRKLVPTPVKKLAERLQLPIEQPSSFRSPQAQAALVAFAPDVLVVAAYGQLLPPAVLAIPRYGCINVHPSLLPRWRGAAPIERAIMAGDTETGVCIMQMEEGLDTGPVFSRQSLLVDEPVDPAQLEQALATLGSELLCNVLAQFDQHKCGESELPKAEPQTEAGITYAHKLTGEDRHIDWKDSAAAIASQINALSARAPVRCRINETGVQLLQASAVPSPPFPEGGSKRGQVGSIAHVTKREIFIQCETQWLQLHRLLIEGGKGKPMDAAGALNGYANLFTPHSLLRDAS